MAQVNKKKSSGGSSKKGGKGKEGKMTYSKEQIYTPIMRVLYPSLLKKSSFSNTEGDDSFQFTGILPKSDSEKLKPLKLAMLKLAKERWGDNIKLKEIKTPIKDGDKKKFTKGDKKGEVREEYAGNDYLAARSKRGSEFEVDGETIEAIPVVVGKNKTSFFKLSPEQQKKINPDRGGYYAVAQVTLAAYDQTKEIVIKNTDGSLEDSVEEVKGITFYLNGVWFIKDGERQAGGNEPTFDDVKVDESEFSDDEFDAALGGDDDLGEEEGDDTPFDDEIDALGDEDEDDDLD